LLGDKRAILQDSNAIVENLRPRKVSLTRIKTSIKTLYYRISNITDCIFQDAIEVPEGSFTLTISICTI
jgi:hypothetical protein